jgi:hypothetical protein
MTVHPVHHPVMIKIILEDPTALASILVLLGGTALLLWALKTWFQQNSAEQLTGLEDLLPTEDDEEKAEHFPEAEQGGEPGARAAGRPTEAAHPSEQPNLIPQLIERLNQMTERVYLIEKKEPEAPTMEMAHKLEMIMNRLTALESVVQKNTAQSGQAPFDKEISLAFKGLMDRISILEKAVLALHAQETSSTLKREVV